MKTNQGAQVLLLHVMLCYIMLLEMHTIFTHWILASLVFIILNIHLKHKHNKCHLKELFNNNSIWSNKHLLLTLHNALLSIVLKLLKICFDIKNDMINNLNRTLCLIIISTEHDIQ